MKLIITLDESVNQEELPLNDLRAAVIAMINKMSIQDFETEVRITPHETIPNAYQMRFELTDVFVPDIKLS